MALRDQLNRIAAVNESPCVSISLNTHRTHPDNQQDEIILKNLLKEAENRLLNEFNKRDILPLLEKIESISDEIDVNYNLDSLHIYLSNSVKEVIKSTWETTEKVEVYDNFNIRPLIKAYNRSEEYLILKVTTDNIHLYEALDNAITNEIKNDFFPFSDGVKEIYNADKGGDQQQVSDRVKELYNRIDKAAVKAYNEIGLKIVVIASDQNYKMLLSQADRPDIYAGYVTINNNEIKEHQLAEQAWEFVKSMQFNDRKNAIELIKANISKGLVITDVYEIYTSALDGRGELLVVNSEYQMPVKLTGERTFDIVEDADALDFNDDLITDIAWNIISKNGTVYFTQQEELAELGPIALLARY